MSIKPIKGMKALLPRQTSLYRHVLDSARETLELQGYEEVMPNVIESESLYKKTLGLTSDIVLKEMYYLTTGESSSTKKDTSRQVLRPEGTAGVLRSILNDPDLMACVNR